MIFVNDDDDDDYDDDDDAGTQMREKKHPSEQCWQTRCLPATVRQVYFDLA